MTNLSVIRRIDCAVSTRPDSLCPWGYYVLILHGVPSIVGVGKPSSKALERLSSKSIDFVVPDDRLAAGQFVYGRRSQRELSASQVHKSLQQRNLPGSE
ncbi:hypothetical protein ACRALDRAFT_1066360 [Sodiomyces alcalophilus JCM 7366]|uniref:uncharacterized protein n=1 Tax=Sodiomyces alcalophilus JCM 7366 TaxID=591952 RepID=UPI0039B5C164